MNSEAQHLRNRIDAIQIELNRLATKTSHSYRGTANGGWRLALNHRCYRRAKAENARLRKNLR